MWPLDMADRVLGWLVGAGAMPPNRFRIRIGAGNRILGNQIQHASLPVSLWFDAFASGAVTQTSDILDLGCGCGRYAWWLWRYSFFGKGYTGRYTGLDVDREMIDWCGTHYDARFRFLHVDDRSEVYNPGGATGGDRGGRWPVDDASQDFVFSVSVLTHLLAEDLERSITESARVLRPGGRMQMTVFCVEHFEGRAGGRWSFRHRRGPAYIESEKYPEAAVAYEAEHLLECCREAGLVDVELIPGDAHSLLRASKPGGVIA
ncbi:MAG: class I SAM-dependent methyltransferase [Phycisphaerales bacterium]|nr:class I SAM-dependent methyltransferase [Phycisphaerales bacterium]